MSGTPPVDDGRDSKAVAAPIESRSRSLELVIIGVDGKPRANLGTVDYWHRNPLRRAWWALVGRPRATARIHRANRGVPTP